VTTTRHWLKRHSLAVLLTLTALLGTTATLAIAQLGANTIVITSAPQTGTPAIRAQGLASSISINCVPKGSGTCQVNGVPIITSATTFTLGSVIFGGVGGAFSQDNANFFWDDTNNRLGLGGTTTPTTTLDVRGLSNTSQGTATTIPAKIGGRVFTSTADLPTTGLVLETLATYTVPANALAVNGQSLKIRTVWTTAADGDAKTALIVYGGTTIFSTGAVAFNNDGLVIECEIFRTGAATQKASCAMTATENVAATSTGGASSTFGFTTTTPAETLSGAVALLFRGTTPTTAGDLVLSTATVDWNREGQ
jgi:hypothetical protein